MEADVEFYDREDSPSPGINLQSVSFLQRDINFAAKEVKDDFCQKVYGKARSVT
jgi:hypothetical protein